MSKNIKFIKTSPTASWQRVQIGASKVASAKTAMFATKDYSLTDDSTPQAAFINAEETQSFDMMPWGKNNNLPQLRKQLVEGNNIIPQLLKTARNIFLGSGFYAYRNVFEEGRRRVEEVEMPDAIAEFIEDAVLRDIFLNLAGDYMLQANAFPLFTPDRRGRLARLDYIPSEYMRAVEQDEMGRQSHWLRCADWDEKFEHRVVAIRNLESLADIPREEFVFHIRDPFITDHYYAVPTYWTGYEWIEIGNNIADFHKWNLENGYFTPLHVEIPAGYFYDSAAVQKSELTAVEAEEREKDAIEAFLKELDEAVAGTKNSGKPIWSEYQLDQRTGKEYGGIKITPINRPKTDEAMLKLFDKTNEANISGTGMHPSLAAILNESALSSGSEIRNALLMYISTQAQVPRQQLLKVFTIAGRMNGWAQAHPGVKIGIRDIEITTLDANPTASQNVAVG